MEYDFFDPIDVDDEAPELLEYDDRELADAYESLQPGARPAWLYE